MKSHVTLSALALLLLASHITAQPGFFGNIADAIGKTAGKIVEGLSNLTGLGKKNAEEKELKKMIKGLMDADKKKGVIIGNYVGDYYISVREGKLVGTKDKLEATLFDIDTTVEEYHESTSVPVILMPWVRGEQRVITYNDIGDAINIDILTQNSLGRKKSDVTIFQAVIAPKAEKPVYQIVSNSRKMCITMDNSSLEYTLMSCANGGNDLQIFKFLTYDEAREQEQRKGGEAPFNLQSFMKQTPPMDSTILVGNTSGVLYREETADNEDL